jgi:hypothetical protein
MGLLDKIQPKAPQETPKDDLEKKEIEFILNTIKNSSFKGEDLDILYRVVVKLQNQYIKLET